MPKSGPGSLFGPSLPCPHTRWAMRRPLLLFAILTVAWASLHAQWAIENSTTTADLRGVDNVGGGIAWASGTNGTVVRTEDGGYLWQPCAIPPGAEHLDFRGIQAFDANTAIVMSSGKGDLSRLYKTTDGCQTWKLLFTNPDEDGFWDAIRFEGSQKGVLLGDPVQNHFAVFISMDGGQSWTHQKAPGLDADPSREGIFAASNSSLVTWAGLAHRFFVTGGSGGARFVECHGELQVHGHPENVDCLQNSKALPLASGLASTGAFSLAFSSGEFVAVGGDYTKADESGGTAAYSHDGGEGWTASETSPHGFRSAVACDAATKTWITVGPNGTDISTDDGRNWRAVHPDAALHEQPDADRNWNALSLPFVVGPHGRIGKLDAKALAPAQH